MRVKVARGGGLIVSAKDGSRARGERGLLRFSRLLALRWTGLYCDTPDLGAGGLIYLACGLILRLRPEGSQGRRFLALGAVLGLGYLAKTVVFPLAFVLLGVAVLRAGGLLRRLGSGA